MVGGKVAPREHFAVALRFSESASRRCSVALWRYSSWARPGGTRRKSSKVTVPRHRLNDAAILAVEKGVRFRTLAIHSGHLAG